MDDLLALVKQFGPIVAIFVFFIWRDYRREESMTTRIQAVEDYIRGRLENLVVESTKVIKDNTETRKDLIETLDLRPCLHGKLKGQ